MQQTRPRLRMIPRLQQPPALSRGLRLDRLPKHIAQFFAGLVLMHGADRVIVGRVDYRFLIGSGDLQITILIARDLAAILVL